MDRVPLSEVGVKPEGEITPEAASTQTETEPIKPPSPLNFMDYPDYHRFADFFDVSLDDRRNETLANELNLLWEWGRQQSGSDDRLKISMALKNLTSQIGTKDLGPSLVKQLYKWIRLDYDRQRIEEKMDLIKVKYA